MNFDLGNIPDWVWTPLVIVVVIVWWRSRKKKDG